MKTKTMRSSVLALALSSALTGVFCPARTQAQTPLNLDANPSFDFPEIPDFPDGDPLFAPALLGLNPGSLGYDPG